MHAPLQPALVHVRIGIVRSRYGAGLDSAAARRYSPCNQPRSGLYKPSAASQHSLLGPVETQPDYVGLLLLLRNSNLQHGSSGADHLRGPADPSATSSRTANGHRVNPASALRAPVLVWSFTPLHFRTTHHIYLHLLFWEFDDKQSTVDSSGSDLILTVYFRSRARSSGREPTGMTFPFPVAVQRPPRFARHYCAPSPDDDRSSGGSLLN
ncbi:uncharacterized protein LOC129600271 [Paramacrobiotus metropolitanus]|uniref:uncharacterized protein LOC129600271 n=1 Tax=Paramacrobiotus metropolitanus TaxID=2943436 RepID=UPI002445E9CF|nr:uncharacterized protein LOC129600271 [Paramacrobiotus metropolitanus]